MEQIMFILIDSLTMVVTLALVGGLLVFIENRSSRKMGKV